MLKSSSAERQARRKSSSSTSRSSLVTVRPLEPSRSPSRSRLSTGSTSARHGDLPSTSVPKRSRSISTTRTSTNLKMPSLEGILGDIPGTLDPWSQSNSDSNLQGDHKRIGSALSHKTNPSPSSLGVYIGMSRRTPSPSKRQRPTDLPINGNNLAAPTGLMARGGTAFPLESPLPTSDNPRTPLLHEGQIGASSEDEDHGYQSRNAFDSQNFFSQPAYQQPPQISSSIRESNNTQTSAFDLTNLARNGDSITRPARPLRSTSGESATKQSNSSSERNEHHAASANGRSPPQRTKVKREKDKKTMLASALQRANDAVQLDNAQDYTGAIEAYVAACDFLTEVMMKSSSDGDKRKLEAIRSTYTDRIREIRQLEIDAENESSSESHNLETSSVEGSLVPEIRPSLDGSFDEEDSRMVLQTARTKRIVDRVASTQPNAMSRQVGSSDDARFKVFPDQNLVSGLAPPSIGFMPAPLSPRRPPPEPLSRATHDDAYFDQRLASHTSDHSGSILAPEDNGTNGSWLDSIEEHAGSSPASSHHSFSSLNQLRRKHLRVHSSNTEAEFDAALDAAVEAAYDDGYEPYFEGEVPWQPGPGHPRASTQNPVPANSSFQAANSYRHIDQTLGDDPLSSPSPECDEEERILQEAEDYVDNALGQDSHQAKSIFPRQSNSSTSSGRTWGSSVASSLTTAGTSLLSTVDEHTSNGSSSKFISSMHPPPSAPPPTSALPQPPTRPLTSNDTSKNGPAQTRPQLAPSQSSFSVQDRRLSGQKGKRLKIETTITPRIVPAKSTHMSMQSRMDAPNLPPKNVSSAAQLDLSGKAREGSGQSHLSLPFPTPFQATFTLHDGSALSPPTPAPTSALSNDSSIRPSPSTTSPDNSHSRPIGGVLRSNGSSISLRNKGLLTPGAELYERSPATPSTATTLSVPSSSVSNGAVGSTAETLGALHLSGPRAQPRPLELCPESQLLRPYWLMRCFYQTVAHPDGGYLTTSLCIPRKVWQVANVKLKHVDDKVANCDLLSAALHKLGTIDTLDADAVLEEMEAFEAIMSQVQTNLSKKLGNDVGPQNISSQFKDAPLTSPSAEGGSRSAGSGDNAGNTNSTSSRSSSKSYFSSLRKLRGKASDTSLVKGYTSVKESPGAEGAILSTVPMTSSLQAPSVRAGKRDMSTLGFEVKAEGPQASYMGAVGKLCDAVQVLDQIARQVEDPGLKHSSPTHVGLELSSKHASEFFGLYICRFILQDILMLAEKHVKRASEYVLS